MLSLSLSQRAKSPIVLVSVVPRLVLAHEVDGTIFRRTRRAQNLSLGSNLHSMRTAAALLKPDAVDGGSACSASRGERNVRLCSSQWCVDLFACTK